MFDVLDSEKRASKMPHVRVDFDDLLEELGEFGRFQISTYILICFPVMFAAANSLAYLFVAGKPDYRCLVPLCDTHHGNFSPVWIEDAIPSLSNDKYQPSECTMFAQVENVSSIFNGTCGHYMFTRDVVSCNEWISYNNEKTIFNEWNMYCQDAELWKLPFVGTIHFAGIVAGSAIFGVLADTFGRKSIFLFTILLMNISGVAQVLSNDYYTFLVFIFINALGTSGVYPLAFIIGVELVGKKKREFTGIVLNYFYTIGEASIGVVAYFFRDWIIFQLIISAPSAIFVVYYWFIPESVRWLLATRRTEKATSIIQKAARVNKVELSETTITNLKTDVANEETKDPKDKSEVWPVIKNMFSSKKIILRFLIIFIIWLANVFTFYGLSVNSVNMSGNKYLNFILTSLAGIPGYTLAWWAIGAFGRRISLSSTLILCAVSNVIVIFVTQDNVWLAIVMYLVAKMFVTASLGIIYIYTAELLPTIIRSGGVGAASTISRLGAMVAPFVPYIDPSIPYLPLAMFASISAIAGLLSLLLPETLGKKLPETAEDAKSI